MPDEKKTEVVEVTKEGKLREPEDSPAEMITQRNRGLGMEGVSCEKAIVESLSEGQGDGWAMDGALEGFGVEGGGSFSDDLYVEPVQKRRLTQRERREERRSHRLVRAKDQRRASQNNTADGLPATAQELRKLQETDESLAKVTKVPGYFQRDGIRYRYWAPHDQEEEEAVEQVILPKHCRRPVLELAHTIPLGGHLRKKTGEKILQRFYWPTLPKRGRLLQEL